MEGADKRRVDEARAQLRQDPRAAAWAASQDDEELLKMIKGEHGSILGTPGEQPETKADTTDPMLGAGPSGTGPDMGGDPDQGKAHPLLGAGPSGTGPDKGGDPKQGTPVPKTRTGEAGTWETAAMAVGKTLPTIIEAMNQKRQYAATPNIGGRKVMDIPTAGGIYGKREPGFQSLLARLLAGGR